MMNAVTKQPKAATVHAPRTIKAVSPSSQMPATELTVIATMAAINHRTGIDMTAIQAGAKLEQ